MEAPRTPTDTPSREMTLTNDVIPPSPITTGHASAPRRATHHFERKPASRVPTCTHMTMNRLYGPYKCHMCGKVPGIGWLYSCQQDGLSQHHHLPESEALPAVEDDDNYFEAQAKVAESLHMGRSVIKQMRQGQYTYDQVDIILEQRRHVLDVIRNGNDSTRSSTPSYTVSSGSSTTTIPADEPIIATAGMTAFPPMAAAPAIQRISTDLQTTPTKPSAKKLTCNYQVCHHCRPFLQDRLPMSFEPVVHNEIPAMTESEINKLPLRDADVLRHVGLRTPRPRTPPLAQHVPRHPSPLGIVLAGDGAPGDIGILTEKEGLEESLSSESDSSISLDTESDEEAQGGVAVEKEF